MSPDSIPDKCDICGLKFTFDYGVEDPQKGERLFKTIRTLQKQNIVPKGFRSDVNIGTPGSRIFCSINDHKHWRKKKKPCPNWQPDYHKLSPSNYLSIHYIKETNNLSKDVTRLTIVAVAIPYFYLLVHLYNWAILHPFI